MYKNTILIKQKGCIVTTWIYSALWSFVPLYAIKDATGLEGTLTTCCIDYTRRDWLMTSYVIALSVGGFVEPISVLGLLYALIWAKINERNSVLRRPIRKLAKQTENPSSFENMRKRETKAEAIRLKSLRKRSGETFGTNSIPSKKLAASGENTKNVVATLIPGGIRTNARETNLTTKKLIVSRGSTKLFSVREIRLAKGIMLTFLSFLFAVWPYSLLGFYAQFGGDIKTYLTPFNAALPPLFLKTVTIFNPLIYMKSDIELNRFMSGLIAPFLLKKTAGFNRRKKDLKQMPSNI